MKKITKKHKIEVEVEVGVCTYTGDIILHGRRGDYDEEDIILHGDFNFSQIDDYCDVDSDSTEVDEETGEEYEHSEACDCTHADEVDVATRTFLLEWEEEVEIDDDGDEVWTDQDSYNSDLSNFEAGRNSYYGYSMNGGGGRKAFRAMYGDGEYLSFAQWAIQNIKDLEITEI